MNKTEVLRYMRTNSKTQDEKLLALADEAIEKVEKTAVPKTLCRVFNCEVRENEVELGGYVFKSTRFSENLRGCKRVALFGATLGIECDRMINLALSDNLSLAIALQAAAAQKIEEVCDELEEELKKQYGANLRQRYSPGYFDLDISEQKKVFALLELTKRIGITLSDTCEMLPTKSVTAFIGIE
jgi:hypothetical protein